MLEYNMSELSSDFLNKVFKEAQNDTSLLDTIDINEIISMSENENMDYINEKTMNDILNTIYETLKEMPINEIKRNELYEKLAGYRFIENIYELHKGKHIRWIRHNNPEKITNGAIVAEIKFRDNGTHILCKTIQNKIFQIKYDDCFIFQKLTTSEQLILMAYEYAVNK